jgi:hypothetical protein
MPELENGLCFSPTKVYQEEQGQELFIKEGIMPGACALNRTKTVLGRVAAELIPATTLSPAGTPDARRTEESSGETL